MSDVVNLHLMPGPSGKPQASVLLGVDGHVQKFRRGSVVQMPRDLATAYAQKYNPLTGDFRGVHFRIEEIQEDAPPPPSQDVGELQALVTLQQAQIDAQSRLVASMAEQQKALFAEVQALRGVHPAPASPAVAAEAASKVKAKPKKGQAITTAHFKTGEG